MGSKEDEWFSVMCMAFGSTSINMSYLCMTKLKLALVILVHD